MTLEVVRPLHPESRVAIVVDLGVNVIRVRWRGLHEAVADNGRPLAVVKGNYKKGTALKLKLGW